MTLSTPVRRAPSSLQYELAQRIAQLITDGDYVPGQHLTEDGLAHQYAVSRTPVRLALRLLQEQGFVELRANAGVFVSETAAGLRFAALAPASPQLDATYRALIADRAAGTLAITFSEAELLARYGVPKAQLTRVLLRLHKEGLIERRKGNGWNFAPMLDSSEAHDESYRFRMLIECGGLQEASFKIDTEALRRSREQHERYAAQGLREQAPGEFFEMNASFHELLARCSGNRFVEQAVRQQNQLRRFEEYATFVTRPVHQMESCQEHLQIIDALARNDREWATALLRRHLSLTSRL